MTVVVSVPGKIHLMGEHAVVYGKPAILGAINRRLTVRVDAYEKEAVPALKNQKSCLVVTSESDEYVQKIVALIQNTFNLQNTPPIQITIRSDIKAGYHLGSSAAVAVGVVGALMYHYKHIWNPIAINKLAYEAEKLMHNNPSGGDNTIVTTGGLIWYRKELEFLKSIWQLPVKIPESWNHFYLIDTGRPTETTGDMVSYVGQQRKDHLELYKSLFSENETQTKRLAEAIKSNDEALMMDAIKTGERTLEKIGVVSKLAMKIIRGLEKCGGAAKILGGGGKIGPVGYILCYHPDDIILQKFLKTKSLLFEKIQIGCEGIRLEQKE